MATDQGARGAVFKAAQITTGELMQNLAAGVV
jgi:hypothetical protein